MGAVDEIDLEDVIAGALDRWPAAGLAVGVVRDGTLSWFHGHGVADITAGTPVTPDTVFRIASITKTFTAVAVMQLWEQGRVDLDAPAPEYLRGFELVPARPDIRPPTVRHLLTHTGGIGYWRRLSDLLRPGIGSGDVPMRPPPSLADYYRGGLRVEVEPGTKWMYSNHGIAVLGQIVEDVTGQPFDRYLGEHVLAPLGMTRTALTPSAVLQPRATGYVLGRRGLRPADEGPLPVPAASGLYASTHDLARYVAALLAGGSGAHGRVLEPDTLATMFAPHHQPDPRVPGMGLAFHLDDQDGHRTVGHTGILSGFLAAMLLAPDDGLGVVVLSNTGGLTGRGAADPLSVTVLRRLLGLPESGIRRDLPARPDVWHELCGWYGPDPGPVTNLFARALWGAGVEVMVDDGRLVLKALHPVPAMRHGLRLHRADPEDPYVFRVDLSELGWHGTQPAAFGRDDGGAGPATRLTLDGFLFRRRADARNPRRWVVAAAGGVAVAGAARAIGHRMGGGAQEPPGQRVRLATWRGSKP